jgi:hypothetical protein
MGPFAPVPFTGPSTILIPFDCIYCIESLIFDSVIKHKSVEPGVVINPCGLI